MEENTKVPFFDLNKQYVRIKKEINRSIQEVLESGGFILGPTVGSLEKEIADFLGVPYALGVASGTDALLLALMALGVKKGDAVATTPYTFFSTGGVISRLGARPVFIDIDPETYNLAPEQLEKYLKKAKQRKAVPKVIIPVHLFGQMADMSAISTIARKYEVRVVEDAAQALGARQKYHLGLGPDSPKRKEWMAGTAGDLGCFSFYPSKNLGGFGDGGMVVTRDHELAEKIRILRIHGAQPKYYHRVIGINSRLDALQAAILRVKLKYLEHWTDERRINARRYRVLFSQSGLIPSCIGLPEVKTGYFHIFNQFVIRAKRRDALRQHLERKGIGNEIYYPVPLHLQECYRSLGYHPGDLPQSEKAARETVALPIYPEITLRQQEKVVQAIQGFYAS